VALEEQARRYDPQKIPWTVSAPPPGAARGVSSVSSVRLLDNDGELDEPEGPGIWPPSRRGTERRGGRLHSYGRVMRPSKGPVRLLGCLKPLHEGVPELAALGPVATR
jgi:hypothetical protein